MTERLSVNPNMVTMWAKRDKCVMCKHKFDKPFILPVENPERGKFQPNFNVEAILHLSDTHGITDDISREWITGTIYGAELTEFGTRELRGLFGE